MAGGCKIFALNDDCLYHIYAFLPIIDWCSLRETCTRFRTIADDRFNRRSNTFKLSHISDSDRLKLSEVKRVLRTFGKSMKALSINQNDFAEMDWNVLAPFLDRYCESLLDLELVNFRFITETVVQCRRLFSSLQRLVIDKWDNRYRHNKGTFSTCLVECTSLTELVFIGLDDITDDSLAHIHMKYLKSFELRGCYELSDKAFKSFLTRNCQITQVKLFDVRFRHHHENQSGIEDVANTLPKIEALSLNFELGFVLNVVPVTGMTSLKKLEVNLEHVAYNVMLEVLRGLTEHNNIENLHLAHFQCSKELIGLLSSIKRLKILKLTSTNHLHGNVCKKLATQLSNLEEIHISECNTTSLNDMTHFVMHSPNLRTIVFNRYFTFVPLIAPQLVRSLAEIRLSQATKIILSIFVNDHDFRCIQCELNSTEMEDVLAKYAYLLRVKQLDTEHRRTISEYISRRTKWKHLYSIRNEE